MGIRITHSTQKVIKQMPASQRSRPFGMRSTPFDPRTGKYLALSGTSSIEADTGIEVELRIMLVVTENDDYITCLDVEGNAIGVAKPHLLQRTPFDGETVNSVSYVYSDASTRVASADGEDDETQAITPSYYLGEQLLAIACRTYVEVDGEELTWSDLNTAGRSWAVQSE